MPFRVWRPVGKVKFRQRNQKLSRSGAIVANGHAIGRPLLFWNCAPTVETSSLYAISSKETPCFLDAMRPALRVDGMCPPAQETGAETLAAEAIVILD